MTDIQTLLDRFNDVARDSGQITADRHHDCVRYVLVSAKERLHNQVVYDLVNGLSKANLVRPTLIDLSRCRVVSSIELSFMGFVINQTRYHRGQVILLGATPVVGRALAMVGFDRLCTVAQDDHELASTLAVRESRSTPT